MKLQEMVGFSEQAVEMWVKTERMTEEEESRSSLQFAFAANEFQAPSDRKCKCWHFSLMVRWLKKLLADKFEKVSEEERKKQLLTASLGF